MFHLMTAPYVSAAVDMAVFGNVVNPIIREVVYPAILLLFGVAIVVFIYGVLQLVFHGDDPASREKGQMMILYGTIGLFIMVSAWGIIYLVSNTVKDI